HTGSGPEGRFSDLSAAQKQSRVSFDRPVPESVSAVITANRFRLATGGETVVRGGFGMFYENLNGLNYRNAVVSNGLLSQQASVNLQYDDELAPDEQTAVFPNQVSDPELFSASDISLVDPHFKFPYLLQGSFQIEREILPDTVVTLGTTWTHGVHLIAS